MKPVFFVACLAASLFCSAQTPTFKVKVNTEKEPIQEGKYQPCMESLSDYQCPEWFRNAKFGIWAHWGPQCQAEDGDWYARNMYIEKDGHYRYQIDVLGHPSQYGFKDWIPLWKADQWEPDSLVKLYKEAGAKYFFALANHHDNMDLYNSQYQPWNSVNMGPHKDIMEGWAKACQKYGLPLGVSVHASHAWCWYETSRGSDSEGVLKDIPYDGWLTKEDGKGQWWEGYDPQDLYAQNHPLSKNNRSWDWEEDLIVTPDQAYCDKFYNRTIDLINHYHPSLIYFDDTYLPLYPVSDAGLKIVAHAYNKSMAENEGQNQCVIFGKILNESQKRTIVWDVERGAPDAIQDLPWQTCTCIGAWHYDKHIYYKDRYKTSGQVIQMLVDVVSKNGNLLLSVPLKGNGSLDPTEKKIVAAIGAWMKINGESIYDTRPWVIYGEGPSADQANPMHAQGFNESRVKLSAKDIRFNQKGKILYATTMGIPTENIEIKSLGKSSYGATHKIRNIEMLGSSKKVVWKQGNEILSIEKPQQVPCQEAVVYKIYLR